MLLPYIMTLKNFQALIKKKKYFSLQVPDLCTWKNLYPLASLVYTAYPTVTAYYGVRRGWHIFLFIEIGPDIFEKNEFFYFTSALHNP